MINFLKNNVLLMIVPLALIAAYTLYIDISSIGLKYKSDAFFFDPKKMFFQFIPSYQSIQTTIHYISSRPVSYYNPEDVSKYLYTDQNINDFKKYFKKAILPRQYFKTNIYTLWGVFVKMNGTICHGSTIYRQSHMQYQNLEATFAGYYDEVISVGSVHSYGNWGHSLQDFFNALFVIPQEIIQRSRIVPGFLPVLTEILDVYNVSRSQVIQMSIDDCIFARIVHTITPSAYVSCYSMFSMKLKNLIFHKYQLDLYKPHLYCFMNRNKGEFRYINNFDEIYNYTVNQYPNISFIKLPDNLHSVKENAIRFAKIKFLFSPTGSNLVKTYFMHNNTVIVSAGSYDFFRYYDDSVISSAIFTDVFFLQLKSPLKHFTREVINISVDLCFKYINIGIYCSLNGHWPERPL